MENTEEGRRDGSPSVAGDAKLLILKHAQISARTGLCIKQSGQLYRQSVCIGNEDDYQ